MKCSVNLTNLQFGSTVGIIGGGQLGKMMAQSAQKMGFKVIVLDPDASCPCQYVAHEFINADYSDSKALNDLGQRSDVITYEFENISAPQLKELVAKFNIPQGYEAIELLQDRLTEKQTLQEAHTKIVPFMRVSSRSELKEAIETLGYPFIIKTRFGGYDGKGQILVKDSSYLDEVQQLITQQECVAEQFLQLHQELSLTVTIGTNRSVTFFPLQENEHKNQILFKTVVPARSDKEEEARNEINKIIKQIHFIGTFTVEFFVDQDNNLYVNEIAPRPHNSGHYSIEACDFSQFDSHILAITGQALPSEITLLKPAIMMNLLGKDLDLLETQFRKEPLWHVHIYGKKVRKPNRKMGHLTVLTNNMEETESMLIKQFEGRTK